MLDKTLSKPCKPCLKNIVHVCFVFVSNWVRLIQKMVFLNCCIFVFSTFLFSNCSCQNKHGKDINTITMHMLHHALSASPAQDMLSPDCTESGIPITVRLNYQTRCSMEYFTLQYLHIGIHTAQYMFIILCKIHHVLRLTSRLNNQTFIYYVVGQWKSIYINPNLLWLLLYYKRQQPRPRSFIILSC